MKNNLIFQIFKPRKTGRLDIQIAELELQLMEWMVANEVEPNALIQTRIYLTDAANQWQDVQESSLFKSLLSQGAVSYVEQPLLSGAKITLQMGFLKDVELRKEGSPDCLKVYVGDVMLLLQSVRFMSDEVCDMDSEQQTIKAFERHMDTLAALEMNLEEHCHRTWIYVRDIDRHYAGVVAGRNKVFAANGLTKDTHYITSTGIGGFGDNREAAVCVDFLSVKGVGRDAVKYLHALEYLNPTHEYGVAFERGTRLAFPSVNVSFISGTASIDKYGECLHRGDVLTQAGRLFLNIDKLLNDGGASLSDVKVMLVYLRDIADYDHIYQYMTLRFPHIPFLITEARVCRPEWLIEVECVAVAE